MSPTETQRLNHKRKIRLWFKKMNSGSDLRTTGNSKIDQTFTRTNFGPKKFLQADWILEVSVSEGGLKKIIKPVNDGIRIGY